MSLAGCQIILIDLNFHLKKCLEIFDKNSADKIQFKNYKEVNPPCLMPIRVNSPTTKKAQNWKTFLEIWLKSTIFLCNSIWYPWHPNSTIVDKGGSGNVSTARESEFYAIEQSATCANRISAMMMTFLNLCLA